MEERQYIIGFNKDSEKFELYRESEDTRYAIRICDDECGFEMLVGDQELKQIPHILDSIQDEMIKEIKILRGE